MHAHVFIYIYIINIQSTYIYNVKKTFILDAINRLTALVYSYNNIIMYSFILHENTIYSQNKIHSRSLYKNKEK